MTGTDLDDILTQVDCPTCGAAIMIPYSQARIQKAAACGCGILFRLTDDTPVSMFQRWTDKANPIDTGHD